MYRRPPVPPQPSAPMTRAPDGAFVFQSLEPRHRPVATWGLTIAIAVGFALQALEDGFDTGIGLPIRAVAGGFTDRFDVLPAAVLSGEWWRIATGAFLHGSLLHLAANAYFGWSIGARVEKYIGAWRMLAITVAAMLGSGLAVTYFSETPAVGFSGVLYGWLASWLAFHLTPRFPGLRLSGPQRSAYLQLLGANLLISLLPGISLLGHAGGFVAGFAVAFVLGQKRGG